MADQFEGRAKKYRKEAQQQQSTDVPVKLTPAEQQAIKDAQDRKKEEAAPTTKTETGKIFKKGGFVRAADGIAKKGKTKGRIV